MQTNSKEFVVVEVANAIKKGCAVASIQDAKGTYHTFTGLPSPQTSGTATQQSTYADMKAREVVERSNITFN